MYRLLFRKEAAKMLLKIPRNTAQLIRKKLDLLAQDPFQPNLNVKPLEGESAYRLRVGDWRIIYEVNNQKLVILVLRIGARGGLYK